MALFIRLPNKVNIVIIILVISTIIVSTLTIIYSIYIQKKTKQSNLVLISIDTLRQENMGIYGYSKNTTPHIDSLGKESYIFTNVYTQVPLTYPSFASLLTGNEPVSTGIIANGLSHPVSNKMATLTKILKKNNFTSAAFITNRFLSTKLTGLSQGFDEYYLQDSNNEWKLNRAPYNNFIRKAFGWLEKNKDKKTFVWIHLMDPHFPYYPSTQTLCTLSKKYCQVAKVENFILDNLIHTNDIYGCTSGPQLKSKADLFKSLYDADILHADKLVGELINKLKKIGLYKKTTIVLYGDHGEGFDHDYYFTHGKVLYNSSVRIPLIIKYPFGFSQGKKINELIANTDILPTILDLLNMNKSTFKFDGKSFASLLFPIPINLLHSFSERKYVYMLNNDLKKYAITDGNYKYIYSLQNACLYNNQTEELYDLKADPHEKNNLNSINLKKKKELKKQLFDYLSQYGLPKKKAETIENRILNTEIYNKLKDLGY